MKHLSRCLTYDTLTTARYPGRLVVDFVSILREELRKTGVKEKDMFTRVEVVGQGIMIEVYGEVRSEPADLSYLSD